MDKIRVMWKQFRSNGWLSKFYESKKKKDLASFNCVCIYIYRPRNLLG